MEKKPLSCFTISLSEPQTVLLRDALEHANWELSDADYCLFKAKKEGTSLAMYRSGKLVAQGKGVSDFIEFILEPMVLKKCLPDPEEEPFSPHAGIDESGKGDFFGPLVVVCAYVKTYAQADALKKCGVRDSKEIKSDDAIFRIAGEIRKILQDGIGAVVIGPQAYNRLYAGTGNLNRLLAWGHARALENLLDREPECPRAIADQFGNESLIRNALMEKGRAVELIQRTKAESDIAVGAASILARSEFVRRMNLLSGECGITLPKGAGPGVERVAGLLVEKGGREILERTAKMHFRTAYRVLGLPEPEKKDWRLFRKKTENRQILQGKWEF